MYKLFLIKNEGYSALAILAGDKKKMNLHKFIVY